MLYDNDKVNLLIGLLKAYDIRNAVLCPGSRNAMIVNNIVADGSFKCYPVSDERSAGFFALGISFTAFLKYSSNAALSIS